MKKIILVVFGILILGSCKKDDDTTGTINTGATAIDLVTGISLTNAYGVQIGYYGNPNILTSIVTSNKTEIVAKSSDDYIPLSIDDFIPGFNVYPNPAYSIVSIGATGVISNIWFIEGVVSKEFDEIDFGDILTNDLYTVDEISAKSFKSIELEGVSAIDVSSFEKGIYRVFVQLESGDIFWQNVAIGNYTEEELNTLWD